MLRSSTVARGAANAKLRSISCQLGSIRPASTSSQSDSASKPDSSNSSDSKTSEQTQPKKKAKTQAELDEELKLKMEGLSGDGGDSGVEYEDGQPASMKRSVRNNMFRYI